MHLASVTVERVQSIDDPIVLENLGHLNVLVGPNGAGKSAILRGLDLVLGSDQSNHPYWVRQGADEALVTVTVEIPETEDVPLVPNWHMQFTRPETRQMVQQNLPAVRTVLQALGWPARITWTWAVSLELRMPGQITVAVRNLRGVALGPMTFTGGGSLSRPVSLGPGLDFPVGTYANALNSLWTVVARRLAWTYIPPFRALARAEAPNLQARATANGDGTANALMRLMTSSNPAERRRFTEVQGIFRQVTGFTLFPAPQPGQNSVHVVVADRRDEDAPRLPLVDSGSGLENFAAYAIHILARDSSVVGLEEPESHLHPGAQRQLWQWLLQWAKTGRQLFVTTHSAAPDAVLTDPDTRVFLVRRPPPRGVTVVVPRAGQPPGVWPDLGYGAGEWVGADGVLLVEGGSDTDLVHHWVRQLAPDAWYRVLPAQGKANAVAAGCTAAFERLGIPFAVLVDRSGQPTVPNSQPATHLYVLDRCELENYLLDPGALAQALDTKVENVKRVLDDELAKWAPVVWADKIWEALPVGLSATARKAGVQALAHGLTVATIPRPANTPQLATVTDAVVSRVLEEHGSLLKRRTLRSTVRKVVRDQTARFWVEWTAADGPVRLAPGKEVLKAVRGALHATLPAGELFRRLIDDGQLAAPDALEMAVQDLRDSVVRPATPGGDAHAAV